MKRIALLLTLLLTLSLTAHADDASRHAKAQEMVDLLHLDRLSAQLMDTVKQQVLAMAQRQFGNGLTDDQKAKLATFQNDIFKLLDDQVGWKAMEPDYVNLYAESFTEEELDAILAFYKSPAGMAMVAKTPELTQKSMQLSQTKLMAILPRLQQMSEDFGKSMAPAMAPLVGAPPPGKGSSK